MKRARDISEENTEAFFQAVKSGNQELVRKIMTEHPELLNQIDKNGWSALNIATAYNKVEIATILLEAGISLDHQAAMGNQKLYPEKFAEAMDKTDLKDLIIKHRQRRAQLAPIKREAPDIKIGSHGQEDITETEKQIIQSTIEDSVKNNLIRILSNRVQEITPSDIESLSLGINQFPHLINIARDDGFNLLHLATYLKNTNLASFLIKHNININAQFSTHQATALHIAADTGNTAMVELLLANNALTSLTDSKGLTAAVAARQSVNYAKDTNLFESIAKRIEQHKSIPSSVEIPHAKEKESSAVSPIPPLIHFIWAGGERELPPIPNKDVVIKWAISNPDCKIILWVDNTTAPIDKERQKDYWQNEYKTLLQQCPNIEIRDIETKYQDHEKVSTPEIRYEIDRIDPNYGASSDLLRYRILYDYGGAYFDSDVEPGKNPLIDIIKSNHANPSHLVYIDHLSQMPRPSVKALNTFKFSGFVKEQAQREHEAGIPVSKTEEQYLLGNDTFICTPHNPLIRNILANAMNNYHLIDKPNRQLQQQIAYSSHNIKALTIEKTGPSIVKATITDSSKGKLLPRLDQKLYTKEIDAVPVQIKPVRTSQYSFSQPLKNSVAWLNVPLISPTNEFELNIIVIPKLLSTIDFELNHLGVIRLDDHIRHLENFAEKFSLNKTNICTKFLSELEAKHFDYFKIQVAQSISEKSLISEFYKKHQLENKHCFPPQTDVKTFNEIVKQVISSEPFELLAKHLTVEEDEGQVSDNFLQLIKLGNYKDQQIMNFAEQIQIGLTFIEKLLNQNLYQYIHYNSEEGDIIENTLNNYKKLAIALMHHYPTLKIRSELSTELQQKFYAAQTQKIFGIFSNVAPEQSDASQKKDLPQSTLRT